MRRPLVFALLAFAGGIATEQLFTIDIKFWITFLLIESSMLIYVYKRIRLTVIIRLISLFFFIFLAGATYNSYVFSQVSPVQPYVNENITVSGVVKAVSEKSNDYFKIILAAENIIREDTENNIRKEISLSENILLNVSGEIEDPQSICGCSIEFTGKIIEPDPKRNPKGFDYALYLKTQKISFIMNGKSSSLNINGIDNTIINRIINVAAIIKTSFIERLQIKMDDKSYALLVGMLFGETAYISEDVYESFQKNGISHILAVSGISIGIIYMCLYTIMGKPKSLILNILILFALIFYAALAGFSASVVRAVFMIAVLMGSKLWNFRYDILSCTSFCAIVILISYPGILFYLGFQLSFLAVLILGVILPRGMSFGERVKQKYCLKKDQSEDEHPKYKNVWKAIACIILDTFIPLFVIQLSLLPVTAYIFNYISFGGFLLNFPIIMLANLIIPLGIILMPLSFPGGLAFNFLVVMEEILIDAMFLLNNIVTDTRLNFKYSVSPSPGTLCFFYFTIFFLCCDFGQRVLKNRRYKEVAASFMAVAIACTGLTCYIEHDYWKADIIMIDVGQGDAVHVKDERGINILMDSGGSADFDVGKKTLMPYFLKNRVRELDFVLISHLHQDHYGGIKTLAHLMPVKKLVVYDGNRLREDKIKQETGIDADQIIYVAAGDNLSVGNEIQVDILYPERKSDEEYAEILKNESDENKMSLVAMLHYKDYSLLVTGDMTSEDEEAIMKEYSNNNAAAFGEEVIYNTSKNSKENRLDADILKVAHHGSKYSSSELFLNAVSPRISVIQVGKNYYGHPSYETINRLKKTSEHVFRNDKDGAVLIDLQKKSIVVKTMLLND